MQKTNKRFNRSFKSNDCFNIRHDFEDVKDEKTKDGKEGGEILMGAPTIVLWRSVLLCRLERLRRRFFEMEPLSF